MTDDPRTAIARSPMSSRQIVAVAMCVLLNALAGFYVLSISFASPRIAADWSMDLASLGIVLPMELIGIAGGSISLGLLADRIGRPPTVLASVSIMACGMAAMLASGDVVVLSACRFVTGIGISTGGMLAVTAPMVAEVANDRSRSLRVALMVGGYRTSFPWAIGSVSRSLDGRISLLGPAIRVRRRLSTPPR